MSECSKYSEERHELLKKLLDKKYDKASLPDINKRVDYLTKLINEHKRVIRVQDALGEAEPEDVIEFFGVESILDAVGEEAAEDYMKQIYEARG